MGRELKIEGGGREKYGGREVIGEGWDDKRCPVRRGRREGRREGEMETGMREMKGCK